MISDQTSLVMAIVGNTIFFCLGVFMLLQNHVLTRSLKSPLHVKLVKFAPYYTIILSLIGFMVLLFWWITGQGPLVQE